MKIIEWYGFVKTEEISALLSNASFMSVTLTEFKIWKSLDDPTQQAQ